jgi:hypothetical protein
MWRARRPKQRVNGMYQSKNDAENRNAAPEQRAPVLHNRLRCFHECQLKIHGSFNITALS